MLEYEEGDDVEKERYPKQKRRRTDELSLGNQETFDCKRDGKTTGIRWLDEYHAVQDSAVLSDNGYLDVAGLEKTTKTYARKLVPSLTKEEYYSSVLRNRGINENSLADLTAALIGVSRKNPREKDAEVIAKLEEVIASLKADQFKDQ